MKTLNFFLLIFLVGLASPILAQNYTFKVMVNKGNSEVKTGSKWEPVKTGMALNSGDELKVPVNAYLGLVHVSGKPMEIKEDGPYKIADLAAKISGGTTVLNKYTDFILSANTEKGNRLQATGAVHRGLGIIKVYLPTPENSTVFEDNLIIPWDTEKIKGPYKVEFNSMFGDELAKMETAEGFVKVNLNDSKFKIEDNIYVVVSSLSDATKVSDRFIIKRLSKGDKERIKVALNQIEGVTSEENALGLYILAGFYESNLLLIDAITCYQKAIALEPDAYKDSFKEFLIRNALVETKK